VADPINNSVARATAIAVAIINGIARTNTVAIAIGYSIVPIKRTVLLNVLFQKIPNVSIKRTVFSEKW
jgi:hypothetical protein